MSNLIVMKHRLDRLKQLAVYGSEVIDEGASGVLFDALDALMPLSLLCVVGGGRRGPGRIGAAWAKVRRVKLLEIQESRVPGWAAVVVRNKQIEERSEGGICFWDGKSKGAKDLTELFRRKNKTVVLVTMERVKERADDVTKWILAEREGRMKG